MFGRKQAPSDVRAWIVSQVSSGHVVLLMAHKRKGQVAVCLKGEKRQAFTVAAGDIGADYLCAKAKGHVLALWSGAKQGTAHATLIAPDGTKTELQREVPLGGLFAGAPSGKPPTADEAAALRKAVTDRIAKTGRLIIVHSWAGWFPTLLAQRPLQVASELAKDACVILCAPFQEPTARAADWKPNEPLLAKPDAWREWLKTDAPVRILYTSWPNKDMAAMADTPDGWHVVYDCIDLWDSYEDATWYKPRYEQDIVDRADLVIATSQRLVDYCDTLHPRRPAKLLRNSTILLPNADPAAPKAVDCVYCGHIRNDWFDKQAISALAEAGLSVRIIGNFGDAPPFTHPNVTWVGPIASHDLMPHLQDARVGIIPFKASPMIEAVDPIKVYDYTLAGLPTIATGLPELEAHEWALIADSIPQFVAVCNAYVRAKPNTATIRDYGERDTAAVRIGQLKEWLADAGQWFAPRPQALTAFSPPKPKVWTPPVQDWPECSRRVAWIFATTCRANCFYCGAMEYTKREAARGDRWWTGDMAEAAFRRAYDDYGPLVVEMSGLESTDQPELMGRVADCGHKLMVSTNLGFDLPRMVAAIKDPASVQFPSSFHPRFWGWSFSDPDNDEAVQKYLEKVAAVREAGFNVSGSSIVAHPLLLDHVTRWLEQLRAGGIDTTLHPFQGDFDGQHYPESFTDEQRAIITPEIDATKAKFALDFSAPECKCAAGMLYANIALDGTVTRCIGHPTKVGGNFFREPLRFADAPQWCFKKMCVCNQLWPYQIRHGQEFDASCLPCAESAVTVHASPKGVVLT